MNEVSYFGAQETINTVTLDDPELFKYPVAYIIEVGWWTLTDAEAAALRAYMQKGGFVIVDDFKVLGWRAGFPAADGSRLRRRLKRVLPDVQFLEHDAERSVFHTFFEINDLDHFPQA